MGGAIAAGQPPLRSVIWKTSSQKCHVIHFHGNNNIKIVNSCFKAAILDPWQRLVQTDSEVDASRQNQNLRTYLRRVAKRICKSACKFTQVAKSRNFRAYYYTVDLRSTCVDLRGQTKPSCVDLRTNWSSAQSQRKSRQVGGQTNRKLNARRKLVRCNARPFGQTGTRQIMRPDAVH